MGRSGESVPYRTVPVQYQYGSLFGLWVSIDQDTILNYRFSTYVWTYRYIIKCNNRIQTVQTLQVQTTVPYVGSRQILIYVSSVLT